MSASDPKNAVPEAFYGSIFVCLPDREGFYLHFYKGGREDISQSYDHDDSNACVIDRSNGCAAEKEPKDGKIAPFFVLAMDSAMRGDGSNELEDYVKDAMNLHKLAHAEKHKELREKLGYIVQPTIIRHDREKEQEKESGSCNHENAPCYLQRCLVCVFDESSDEAQVHQLWKRMDKLRVDWEIPKMRVWRFEAVPRCEDSHGLLFNSKELLLDSPENEEAGQSQLFCMSDRLSINSSPAPLFDHAPYTPIFKTWKKTHDILLMYADLAPVQELLQIADKELLQPSPAVTSTSDPLPHPFVVVEGMDATGKTTLTQTLEERLGALRLFSPPRCLLGLRKRFDGMPEIVRRAYYSVGNYMVAKQVLEECQTRPVIMDRFWHSTAAYGIANESSHRQLPPAGHEVYQWPAELLQPSVVLFLTVSEEVRCQRLGGRIGQQTWEEKALNRDQMFRYRLCEAYRRMREPACQEIDASGTVDSVMEKAVSFLTSHGVQL